MIAAPRIRAVVAVLGMMLSASLTAAPLLAQAKTKRPKSAQGTTGATPAVSLVGGWTGTATVPLPDSTIVVPVLYTFTQSGSTIAGQALVPGQGTGPISHVVVNGRQVRFRVTAPEGKLLEHDGTVGADGSIEGMVNMDKQPIAKFKISPRKDSKSLPKK